jgi:hypothetical protein
MALQTRSGGITFKVHDVEPAADLLRTTKQYKQINARLKQDEGDRFIEIQSCSGYNADCIIGGGHHPLFDAVHIAFSTHRPLVLSPDMIWVTIVQGLSQHIALNAEQLRSKFVEHHGRLTINIRRPDVLPGSPENLWDSVIHELSQHIRAHVGVRYDKLINNFSTTGDVERTACEVCLLEAFQPYFEYAVMCVCGIPEITLEGTPADWILLRQKVASLADYEIDFWLPHLRKIAEQFERAANGDVDLDHWQDIYKLRRAYGWEHINGWIVKLVPYLKDHLTGKFRHKNPLLFDDKWTMTEQEAYWGGDNAVTSRELPSGLSQAAFILAEPDGQQTPMQFLGGFLSIEQDQETRALRPQLGWAVRKSQEMDAIFTALPHHTQTFPPLPAESMSKLLQPFYEAADNEC